MKMILSTIIPKIGYEDLDKQLSKDKCDFAPCQISVMGTAKNASYWLWICESFKMHTQDHPLKDIHLIQRLRTCALPSFSQHTV